MTTKTIESIIARHNELQHDGVSKLTPRKGFYYIQEVFTDSKYVEFYKAKALWKEYQDDQFLIGAQFTIQLTSLLEDSADPKKFDPEGLVNKTIVIHNTVLSEFIFKSITYPRVRCYWAIDCNPVIIQSAGVRPMKSFFDSFKGSVSDMVAQVNNSLNDTILYAIEDEENRKIDDCIIVEDPNDISEECNDEDVNIDSVSIN